VPLSRVRARCGGCGGRSRQGDAAHEALRCFPHPERTRHQCSCGGSISEDVAIPHEAGLINSPPLALVDVLDVPVALQQRLNWRREVPTAWADSGMVPRGPRRRRSCYQCAGPCEASERNEGTDGAGRVPVCQACSTLNARKCALTANFTGMTALVTGARAKIGFEIAVKLLRSGATAIATSRFPFRAAQKYAADPRTSAFVDRLHIYGVDFRHVKSLVEFSDHLVKHYPTLDILIHNAAQTVRRPPAYCRQMFGEEFELGTTLASVADHDVHHAVRYIGVDPHHRPDTDTTWPPPFRERRRDTFSWARRRNTVRRRLAAELNPAIGVMRQHPSMFQAYFGVPRRPSMRVAALVAVQQIQWQQFFPRHLPWCRLSLQTTMQRPIRKNFFHVVHEICMVNL